MPPDCELLGVREEMINNGNTNTQNEINNENEEMIITTDQRPGTPRALLVDEDEEEYEVSSGLLRDSGADE